MKFLFLALGKKKLKRKQKEKKSESTQKNCKEGQTKHSPRQLRHSSSTDSANIDFPIKSYKVLFFCRKG